MDAKKATSRHVRENGIVRLLPGRKGLALRAGRGTFLVTQERDPEDHVLEPSRVYRARRRGLVVVWALSDGELDVEPDAGEPPEAA
ncbi:MAG TPA: hypothetical protein VH880_04080 [Anaeromyxobacteraceae bacterium]|jgi:hypothetical protein